MFAPSHLNLKRPHFEGVTPPSKRQSIQELEKEEEYVLRSNQILQKLNHYVDFSQKESYLKRIVHKDSYAKFCLAELYLEHGQEFEKSYKYLEEFLETLKSIFGKIEINKVMSKDYGIAHGLLAEKYLNLGEFENADKHIREGMKHGSLIARCARGDSLRLQKRFDQAKAYWENRLNSLERAPSTIEVEIEKQTANKQLKELATASILAELV